MNAKTAQLMFVYGTLKRGFFNHYLIENAEFKGLACTQGNYPLVIAGPWYAPSMLDQSGEGLQIYGELVVLDDATLMIIDRLERVGQSGGYVRRSILVNCLGSVGTPYEAQVYLKPFPLQEEIHTANLSAYDDSRYIPPNQRGPVG